MYSHYNEPFAGGLSVLFAHDPDEKSETVNDLNQELTNFWRVLREDDLFESFERWAHTTPFSELMFKECTSADAVALQAIDFKPIQAAKALWFFVQYRQSRQGLGKDFATPTRRTRRGMNENVSAWLSAVDGLSDAHQRLRRVEIRNMDAIAFIKKYDHENAFFYLDPPYLHETRVTTNDYQHEMTPEQHSELLFALNGIEGRFLLSGYPSERYNHAQELYGWKRVEKKIDNKASSKAVKEKKTECLWMNYVQ